MTCFVILHYKNINDTLECINSIKKINDDKKIIVVDNNSLNDNDAKNLSSIVDDLILLKENLGFAKANNTAVKLTIKKYDPEFICVLNNDTLINDEKFIKKIKDDYKKYNFDLLGTKIISPGDSCNPFPVYKDVDTVNKEILKTKKLIKIYKSKFLTEILKFYITIKHLIKKPRKLLNGNKLEQNVALHCCGVVFSKKYLNKYDDAFYNDTFLFHEEEFLYQRIIKDKLISIYDPDLEIYHKEGSSLNRDIKNIRKKKSFREKERLKSLELLKKYM